MRGVDGVHEIGSFSTSRPLAGRIHGARFAPRARLFVPNPYRGSALSRRGLSGFVREIFAEHFGRIE
jgi:hypothetical protein